MSSFAAAATIRIAAAATAIIVTTPDAGAATRTLAGYGSWFTYGVSSNTVPYKPLPPPLVVP